MILEPLRKSRVGHICNIYYIILVKKNSNVQEVYFSVCEILNIYLSNIETLKPVFGFKVHITRKFVPSAKVVMKSQLQNVTTG